MPFNSFSRGRLPFTAVTEGVQGGDLPLCMGDVLQPAGKFSISIEGWLGKL